MKARRYTREEIAASYAARRAASRERLLQRIERAKNAPPRARKARRPLRPTSAKKAAWRRQYAKELARRKAEQEATAGHTFCQRCRKPATVDGHHPAGQAGVLIMLFFLLCRLCHDWAHFTSPKQAREEGWLH
jgi:hypothetical protein